MNLMLIVLIAIILGVIIVFVRKRKAHNAQSFDNVKRREVEQVYGDVPFIDKGEK